MKLSKEELEKYFAYYPNDTEFASYCRYLQSKWRESKDFPIDKKHKYGNYIDYEFAKSHKSNFITQKIGKLVENEVKDANENGKLISEPRIWNNLLSSQPLSFNLFGELCFDLNLATRLFKKLFPDIIEKVTKIEFEYSPGRKNNKYTGDRSAFDIFIEYAAKKAKGKGFLGIEVKYIETLAEESKQKAEKIFSNHRDRYIEISKESSIFKNSALDKLQTPPLSQIWRDHMLAISLKQDYQEGYFVFIYPEKNLNCQKALDKYDSVLISKNSSDNMFLKLTLEKCINILESITDSAWVKEFKARYIG